MEAALCMRRRSIRGTIIVRAHAPSPEKKAAQMLTGEIFKRTQWLLQRNPSYSCLIARKPNLG